MPLVIDPQFFEAAAKAAELQRRADAEQWQAMARAVAMGLLPSFMMPSPTNSVQSHRS